MVSEFRKRLKSALDRPGGRALLGLLVSVRLTCASRRFTRVFWEDGMWIHRFGAAAIPDPNPGGAPQPADFMAEARDIFVFGYLPEAGDTVFDIGAGVGETSLLFSTLVGERGRVVSIEAHPETFSRLERLCRANRLDNVTAINAAVADRAGTVTISNQVDYVLNSIVGEDPNGIEVPCRTLDEIALELGVDHVDLLKMNIEGAERSALLGLTNTLEHVANVCIGCHDFLAELGAPDTMRTKQFCRDFLREHDFAVSSRDDAEKPWIRDYIYGRNLATGRIRRSVRP